MPYYVNEEGHLVGSYDRCPAPPGWKPGERPVYISCFFVCLCLTGLLLSGIFIVKPYNAGKDFARTKCRTNKKFNEIWKAATWKNCTSWSYTSHKYRCVKVKVMFEIPGQGDFLGNFYKNDEQLGEECSYTPHCEDGDSNEKQVSGWLEDLYKVGAQFECFYNPNDGTKSAVFKYRKYTINQAIHSMLWLALGLLVCVFGLVFASYRCNKMNKRRIKITFLSTSERNIRSNNEDSNNTTQTDTEPPLEDPTHAEPAHNILSLSQDEYSISALDESKFSSAHA